MWSTFDACMQRGKGKKKEVKGHFNPTKLLVNKLPPELRGKNFVNKPAQFSGHTTPTDYALLINFRLSFDAEILLIITD